MATTTTNIGLYRKRNEMPNVVQYFPWISKSDSDEQYRLSGASLGYCVEKTILKISEIFFSITLVFASINSILKIPVFSTNNYDFCQNFSLYLWNLQPLCISFCINLTKFSKFQIFHKKRRNFPPKKLGSDPPG